MHAFLGFAHTFSLPRGCRRESFRTSCPKAFPGRHNYIRNTGDAVDGGTTRSLGGPYPQARGFRNPACDVAEAECQRISNEEEVDGMRGQNQEDQQQTHIADMLDRMHGKA